MPSLGSYHLSWLLHTRIADPCLITASSSPFGGRFDFLNEQFHPTSSTSPRNTHSRPISSSSSSMGNYEPERTSRYSSSDEESNSPSSSPERNQTLPPPIPSSSVPNRIASPKRSAGMTAPIRQEQDEGEEEEEEASESRESAFTPLPSSLPRPKTKADREREKSLGLNGGPGKKDSMAKKMMRKRADSLKWSKYATSGNFEFELNLSNDELRRS